MEFFQTTLNERKGNGTTCDTFTLCESAYRNQVFKQNSPSLEKHIKNINQELCDSHKNKHNGLAQLLLLLPQCNKQILTNEGERWLRLCLQNLKGNCSPYHIPYYLRVISYILSRCHDNKDLLNQVSKLSSTFLPEVYNITKSGEDLARCLWQFLLLFSQQALPHKITIEKLLMRYIKQHIGPYTKDVAYAGRVFATLPLPGAADGSRGKMKKARLMQLLSLGHAAMDLLFHSVSENETYQLSRLHKLPIKDLKSTLTLKQPIRNIFTAANILCNVFIFIQEFLAMSNVEFSPKELAGFAVRSLQVEQMALRDAAMETVALSFILPSIHARTLQFIKVLISRNTFGVFLPLVEEQVVTTLRGTEQSNAAGSERGLRSTKNNDIRSLCYEVIGEIVKVARGCHNSTVEGVLVALASDILPSKDYAIYLKSATRGARLSQLNAKKKSKNKGYTVTQDDKQGQSATAPVDSLADVVPVTIAALNLIETVYIYAQDALSLKTVKTLTQNLNQVLHTPKVGAYAKPEVRCALFSTLTAYALYPHPLCPPSYVLLYKAFEEGAADSSHLVSAVSIKGLAALSFATANPSVAAVFHNYCRDFSESGDEEDSKEAEKSALQNGHLPSGADEVLFSEEDGDEVPDWSESENDSPSSAVRSKDDDDGGCELKMNDNDMLKDENNLSEGSMPKSERSKDISSNEHDASSSCSELNDSFIDGNLTDSEKLEEEEEEKEDEQEEKTDEEEDEEQQDNEVLLEEKEEDKKEEEKKQMSSSENAKKICDIQDLPVTEKRKGESISEQSLSQSKMNKKIKTDEETPTPLEEMLETLVDADPDFD